MNTDFFREFILKKFHGKEIHIQAKSERRKVKEDKFRWKKGSESALFASFLKRLLLMLSFLPVPFILMWESYDTIYQNAHEVMPTINDVVNINEIVTHGAQVYIEVSTYLYRNNSVRYMNQYARDILGADIEYISETISDAKGFSPETQLFLHSNICEYYPPKDLAIYLACDTLLKGAGLRGVVSSMLAFQETVRNMKTMIDAVVDFNDLMPVFYDQSYLESYFLLTLGVASAVDAFGEELIAGLIRKLDKASNHTIVLFILGLIFGIMMCIAIGIIIYRYLWRDRRRTCGTLQILPLELIITNKYLRSYLQKEAPKFYKLVKRYEVIRTKERRASRR